MTIQELINQLQEAIQMGYKPDTRICADTLDGYSYWGISLDNVYEDEEKVIILVNTIKRNR